MLAAASPRRIAAAATLIDKMRHNAADYEYRLRHFTASGRTVHMEGS